MWISGTDLPEELVSALIDDKLVVFAGAGVSMNPPSNLPGFRNLACQIAREAGVAEPAENEPIDWFLGKMESKDFNVRDRVQRILGAPESRPNQLHKDLLGLFREPESVRIVTTNFDTHFTAAADEVYGEMTVPVYDAPALPLGHNCRGIVYLHGRLGDSEHLVLTDRDFSSAYLVEGWATRFLKRLFQTYHVLFVGYSHEDVIMQYLARGLPAETETRRYALTDKAHDSKWTHLDVRAIEYSRSADDIEHSGLCSCISVWAERVHMGFLDHQAKMRRLLAKKPTDLTLEKLDYVDFYTKEPPTLGFFAQHATTPEWLTWANHKGFLDPLFLSRNESSSKHSDTFDSTSSKWAEWFADNFVVSQSQYGLAMVQQHDCMLHPVLWNAIARRLSAAAKFPRNDDLAAWIAVLLRAFRHDTCDSSLLAYILMEKCRYPRDKHTALLVFDFMTRPYATLEKTFLPADTSGTDSRRVEARVSCLAEAAEWAMTKSWAKFFKPNLSDLAADIVRIAGANIETAHQILAASGEAHERWDPISFRRSAIEPHQQDEYRRGFDVLIDAARDGIECLVDEAPAVAKNSIALWAKSESPLLRRLAIHGVRLDSSIEPDRKLSWLLENNLLFAYGMKHEAFVLLQSAYPLASEAAKRRILSAAEKECKHRKREADDDQKRQRTAEYELYNLINWLSQCSPACSITQAALTEQSAIHPEFRPRQYSDLDHSLHVGWQKLQSPVSIEHLIGMNPNEFADLVLTYQGDSFEEDREALLADVSKAVAKSHDWTLERIRLLEEHPDVPTDVWSSIVRGWGNATLDEEQWSAVFDFIKLSVDMRTLNRPIGDMLGDLARRLIETDAGLTLPLKEAEDFAHEYWKTLGQVACCRAICGEIDWLTEAINSSGGKLAQFWFSLLWTRWRAHYRSSDTEPFSLPSYYRDCFECVLEQTHVSAQMARIVLASRLHLLFAMDPEWTREKIIPLFDWSSESQHSPFELLPSGRTYEQLPGSSGLSAQQAWHGYLIWGRWTEELLDDLMPRFEQLHDALSRPGSDEELVIRFCRFMAEIAVYGSRNPIDSGWLARFIARADLTARIHFANALGQQLGHLEQDTLVAVWHSWLERYWEARVESPMPEMSEGEAKVMVGCLLQLEPVFSSAVALACKGPAPDFSKSPFFYRLNKSGLARQNPQDVAMLMTHLLPAVTDARLICSELRATVSDLEEVLQPSPNAEGLVEKMKEELARLNCWSGF